MAPILARRAGQRRALVLFIPVCLAGAVLFLSLGRYPAFAAKEEVPAAELEADAAE